MCLQSSPALSLSFASRTQVELEQDEEWCELVPEDGPLPGRTDPAGTADGVARGAQPTVSVRSRLTPVAWSS